MTERKQEKRNTLAAQLRELAEQVEGVADSVEGHVSYWGCCICPCLIECPGNEKPQWCPRCGGDEFYKPSVVTYTGETYHV